MANSRVADIGTLQLAVADGRLLVLYPFWKDPFAFTQFKDENSKMADSRVGDIGTLQLAVADGRLLVLYPFWKWLIQECVISEHCSWQSQMAHTSSATALG